MYDAKNNTIIDLTHEITEKTPSWDLSCGFHTKNICDYDDFNGEFKIRAQSFEIIAGTGTHMDAPAHFIKNSAGISELKLENLIAPCIVINVSEKAHALYTISLDDITTFEKIHGEIHPGNFILF